MEEAAPATMSKSREAVAWLKANPTYSVYAVAKMFGIRDSAIHKALKREKDRSLCPCCGQVVRDGFELTEPKQGCSAEVSAAVVADRRRIAQVLAASVKHVGAESPAGKAYQAIADHIAGMPL